MRRSRTKNPARSAGFFFLRCGLSATPYYLDGGYCFFISNDPGTSTAMRSMSCFRKFIIVMASLWKMFSMVMVSLPFSYSALV